MESREIDRLEACGHPFEAAEFIRRLLQGIKSTKRKENYLKENGHKLHVHIDEKQKIVHINVKEGETYIPMYMQLEKAVKQSAKLLKVNL